LKGTQHLNRYQLVQQLCSEVAARITRQHSTPMILSITTEEMSDLCDAYPATVLLEAATRCSSVVRNNPTLNRMEMMNVLRNLSERLLMQSHAIGKHLMFKGTGTTVCSTPKKSAPKVSITEEDISELQRIFQCEIGDKTLETFTLHPEECTALLAKHLLSELSGTCETVGRWVWEERTKNLRFHDQNTVVDELFRRARVPQPEVVTA
jgi:hypothetical protein